MVIHGTGRMNNNGERMCDQCEFNDLVFGGTIFQHKLIRWLTWKSPEAKTESQIDHILINGKWRRSLQDVRTKRHADTGSDHSIVIAALALKLRRAKLGEKRQKRFNVARLTDPDIKQNFNIALKNNYNVLHNETEMILYAFNQVTQKAGNIIFGYRKTQKEEWSPRLHGRRVKTESRSRNMYWLPSPKD